MSAALSTKEYSTYTRPERWGQLIGLYTHGVVSDDEFEVEKSRLLRVRPKVVCRSARAARATVRIQTV